MGAIDQVSVPDRRRRSENLPLLPAQTDYNPQKKANIKEEIEKAVKVYKDELKAVHKLVAKLKDQYRSEIEALKKREQLLLQAQALA
ncbi:hypothetical protein GUITHDRAFT_111169 [Guillardia theta CCMP2712]|uniref:Uncharacterized protein n=1 Tax=Guillardia theta (strain CCMP2712) TaxID=905079 RepID=L1J3W3_GUITC|nr:hypothetical protein GUITHDRAFT_111169 [Guillardia theta CCMP2712]EKX42799.1 hypothetical protein GUITHDRAFT_111169 [Guillardia theta CCMP2712]|eukprot:XP_005829779.1 hypothetical protein GUITHDRAFT_111169 [Guillardia theta CCMP2712]